MLLQLAQGFLGFDGRAPLADQVDLRLGLGGEFMLKSQAFAINGVPVLDVGRWRLKAELGLVVRLL